MVYISKRKDKTGNTYGLLTVKEMLYGYSHNNTYCRCICKCGNEKIIEAYKLKEGSNYSCGCDLLNKKRIAAHPVQMSGNKYGRLTVIEEKFCNDSSNMVRCICDCENDGWYRRGDVLSGHTQSCGCLQKEAVGDCNTKDFSGLISDCGVKFIKRSYQTERGVWMWNCICPLCGSTFTALPAKVLSNHTTSCGCSIRSSKERMIRSVLDGIGAKYEEQKRFDDCKYKYTLPFDFAVYDSNNTIIALIEYDGAQHYRPVEFLGGDEAYELTGIRDKIKDDYCTSNNIPLIRFSYTQTDEEIKTHILNILNP